MLQRRRILQLSLAAGGAALLPQTAARAESSQPTGTITDLGPASVSTPLGNGEFVGNVLYAGTRGLSPNAVGAFDLGLDRVTTHHDIPTGIGIWAMCSVGTDVYIGTHSQSDLYKLDTLTGSVTKVGVYPYHFIWNLASSPDGKVFLGTSEPGQVVEYDPATGTSRDLGVIVEAEAYVRSIAVDETTIYAGIGAHAHLVAIDRATGAKRDITPDALLSRDFVASLAIDATHIAGGISSNGQVLVMAKDSPADFRILETGEKYVTSVVLHDGYVYFAGRPSGMLYRCAIEGGEVQQLGVAQPEAATHRLLVHEGRIYGVQDGAVFVYDPAGGTLGFLNLVQRGFKAAPEQPMSVHSDGRYVYVGGKGGADIHDTVTGATARLGIPGEPKVALSVLDTTYLGVYTQGLLYSHRAGQTEAKLLARTGNQQDRPRDLDYDEATGLIVMSTQPEPGQINGAISLYAVRTGAFQTYRGVIERQSVYGVTCRAGVAYLGTNIQEGLGLPPVTTAARLAAYDLKDRRVLWQLEPVPAAKVIPGLAHTALAVYGITDTGVLFEYSLLHRKVTRTVKVGSRGGDLVIAGWAAYTTDGKAIYRVNLASLEVTAIATDLAGDWFGGEPKLALDPSRKALYGLRGRNLIRVAI
ncbi:MAG TPA: hypothetical protein VF062_20690 [Candidatus Limnocylindrales bacterium]